MSLPIRIKISTYAAFIGGVLTPALETIRRWHQLSDLHYFINWFDDYLIGGCLFLAALKTYRSPAAGIRFLIAAWGFATGMSFYSFFGQLQNLNHHDPAPVSPLTVMIIKGIMFLVCLVNMILLLSKRHVDLTNDDEWYKK